MFYTTEMENKENDEKKKCHMLSYLIWAKIGVCILLALPNRVSVPD